MATIFHITTPAEWTSALTTGTYRHPSLDTEGFIHFSAHDQVVATTRRYYESQHGLLLLEVDDASLGAPLRWEPSTGGAEFPHLYGELSVDAVSEVHPWEPEDQQAFDMSRGS